MVQDVSYLIYIVLMFFEFWFKCYILKLFFHPRFLNFMKLYFPSTTYVIQSSKDPLDLPISLVTRIRAKKFKETFNGLFQDAWTKVDFKSICNNTEQTLINLIHVQRGMKLIRDYNYVIHYHPSKPNVIANILNKKGKAYMNSIKIKRQ